MSNTEVRQIERQRTQAMRTLRRAWVAQDAAQLKLSAANEAVLRAQAALRPINDTLYALTHDGEG